MVGDEATALAGGFGLLERATAYAIGTLHAVAPDDLARPTPCVRWDLASLLRHLDDSMAALHEAVHAGIVQPDPCGGAGNPIDAVRERARLLLGAVARARGTGVLLTQGRSLTSQVVAGAGALEIAVHGWDVAIACRNPRALPSTLACELLELAPLLVTGADRPARFAAPLDPGADACQAERLLAFLGRPLPAIAQPGNHEAG